MAQRLTYKERKALNDFLLGALYQCHENLYDLCNARHPETIEGVLAENPVARNPAKLAALNKRVNAQSERIEDLLMSIEHPDECECPDNSFLSEQHAAEDLSEAEQEALIQADLAECFGE